MRRVRARHVKVACVVDAAVAAVIAAPKHLSERCALKDARIRAFVAARCSYRQHERCRRHRRHRRRRR